MGEAQCGSVSHQLQTIVQNLISIFGRPRAGTVSACAAEGLRTPVAFEETDVDQLCDEISAECERIQHLQSMFGYRASSGRR